MPFGMPACGSSPGGNLVRNEKFRRLAEIKYKASTDEVLQIEPKEDLKKRERNPPDYAEALMLTHVPGSIQGQARCCKGRTVAMVLGLCGGQMCAAGAVLVVARHDPHGRARCGR